MVIICFTCPHSIGVMTSLTCLPACVHHYCYVLHHVYVKQVYLCPLSLQRVFKECCQQKQSTCTVLSACLVPQIKYCPSPVVADSLSFLQWTSAAVGLSLGLLSPLPWRTRLTNQKSLTHFTQPKQHTTGVSQWNMEEQRPSFTACHRRDFHWVCCIYQLLAEYEQCSAKTSICHHHQTDMRQAFISYVVPNTERTHNNYSQHLYPLHLILHLSLATSGPGSSTGLSPSPTAQPSGTSVHSISPTSTRTTPPTETIPTSTSTPTCPQSTPTPGSPPSQLMIIVIAVVTTTVLLVVVVVVVGLVVVMVAVVCRRRSKEPVYENTDTDVSVQMTDDSTAYDEPKSLDVDPSHLDHQPHPLNTPHINTSAIGDHISMQECPAYQPIEDTPTSGEYTYICLLHYTIPMYINSTKSQYVWLHIAWVRSVCILNCTTLHTRMYCILWAYNYINIAIHYNTINWSLIIYIGLNKVNGRSVVSRLHNIGQDGESLCPTVSKHLNVHCPIHVAMVAYSIAAFTTAPFSS